MPKSSVVCSSSKNVYLGEGGCYPLLRMTLLYKKTLLLYFSGGEGERLMEYVLVL